MAAQAAGVRIGEEDVATVLEHLRWKRLRAHEADAGAHVDVAAAEVEVVAARAVPEDELRLQDDRDPLDLAAALVSGRDPVPRPDRQEDRLLCPRRLDPQARRRRGGRWARLPIRLPGPGQADRIRRLEAPQVASVDGDRVDVVL